MSFGLLKMHWHKDTHDCGPESIVLEMTKACWLRGSRLSNVSVVLPWTGWVDSMCNKPDVVTCCHGGDTLIWTMRAAACQCLNSACQLKWECFIICWGERRPHEPLQRRLYRQDLSASGSGLVTGDRMRKLQRHRTKVEGFTHTDNDNVLECWVLTLWCSKMSLVVYLQIPCC